MIPGLVESNRNSSIPWLTLLVPGVMALAILLVLIVSVPNEAGKRLSEIEAKAAAAAQAVGADGNLKTFPAGSVCSGDFNDALKAQLLTALGNTGVKIESFDAANTGQAATLQAYHVTLKATGSYENALSAINVMHTYRPKIFADTVALHNHISDVELDVQGRLFCR